MPYITESFLRDTCFEFFRLYNRPWHQSLPIQTWRWHLRKSRMPSTSACCSSVVRILSSDDWVAPAMAIGLSVAQEAQGPASAGWVALATTSVLTNAAPPRLPHSRRAKRSVAREHWLWKAGKPKSSFLSTKARTRPRHAPVGVRSVRNKTCHLSIESGNKEVSGWLLLQKG